MHGSRAHDRIRTTLAAAMVAAAALAACGRPGGPVSNHATAGTSEVRAIDWQNHTYTLDALGAVTVVNGTAELAVDDDGKVSPTGTGNARYHVEPALYADIDGDGIEDAVISSVTATGGTGQFSQVEIFTVRDHKVVALGGIAGGDRGDGGIRKLALDGRIILVDRNVLAEGDGICCASRSQTERWSWQHGELVEDIAARKPGPPAP